MLVSLAEELDTSVSTLLGETIQEECLNKGDLKNISEKLEVINLQFAKQSERKIKTIRYSLILVCVIIAVVFIALATMNSEYLTWDFNNPELAIAGTLLHGFEFLFVRLAPFVFVSCFMNMCMIQDDKGNVLALDKVNDSYTGTTFPGGHVEQNEIFQKSMIREVWEETGLTIETPKLCGLYHWHKGGVHYVITLYRADRFIGELTSSEEGQVYWIPLEELKTNEYCHELLNTVQESPYSELPTIKEESSMLSEILDNQIDCYDQSIDPDARIGHKAVNSSFYGYKTHLAMTDERIITAATITSGEAFDGQELPVLVQKSKAAGATVNEVIADTAYSTLENLKDAQSNDYKLISKLNPSIIKGTRSEDGFIFNKDADTMQCPAGHLAIKYRIDKRSNQKKNTRIKYFFDINKCHVCPYRNGCYKENAKTKTYSITIKSDYHKNQEAFQKTQYFKERFKTCHMIEAKNSELKNIHGYSRCDAAGLSNMQLQGAVSIFAVNLKRILKLKG